MCTHRPKTRRPKGLHVHDHTCTFRLGVLVCFSYLCVCVYGGSGGVYLAKFWNRLGEQMVLELVILSQDKHSDVDDAFE